MSRNLTTNSTLKRGVFLEHLKIYANHTLKGMVEFKDFLILIFKETNHFLCVKYFYDFFLFEFFIICPKRNAEFKRKSNEVNIFLISYVFSFKNTILIKFNWKKSNSF